MALECGYWMVIYLGVSWVFRGVVTTVRGNAQRKCILVRSGPLLGYTGKLALERSLLRWWEVELDGLGFLRVTHRDVFPSGRDGFFIRCSGEHHSSSGMKDGLVFFSFSCRF